MEFILSIGLNVGQDEPAYQLDDTLGALACIGRVYNLKLIAGEWQGVPERTLQVRMRSLASDGGRMRQVASMARALNQDCIAMVLVYDGELLPYWTLVQPSGESSIGASIEEYGAQV